jgi:DNA-binding XRE family transcriptional regulator
MKQTRAKRTKEARQKQRELLYEMVESSDFTLPQLVKTFREMLGKSQRDFAKFVGVSPKIIIDFEQGRGNPTLKTFAKLLTGSGLELSVRRVRR